MWHNLTRALLGCRHPQNKRSWPITIEGRTYIVCIECGHEFPFDTNAFRILTRAGRFGKQAEVPDRLATIP